jgi:glyoxylase-like metal-dependent hydrolase (beta-lactamase superfamily II)
MLRRGAGEVAYSAALFDAFGGINMENNSIAIGDVGITALWDFAPSASVAALDEVFPAVPIEAWAPHQRLHPRAFASATEWSGDVNVLLVRTPDRLILVDAGDGPATDGDAPGQSGQLLAALEANGARPEDIDFVVLTHVHGDHIGWNLTEDGSPRFGQARYLLHEREWNFIRRPEVRSRYRERSGFDPVAAIAPLVDSGALDLLTGEAAVTPEVATVAAWGHTGGHTCLLISSQGQRALLLADAAHHPAQVTEPGWSSVYDVDPDLAATTRMRLFDWAERERMVVAAYHFPRPGFGRVVRRDGRFAWEEI